MPWSNQGGGPWGSGGKGPWGSGPQSSGPSPPDLEDLLLLQECDAGGRVPGAVVGTVDEALDYLRELERSNNG